MITIAYVFHVESWTREFPFYISTIIDCIDRLFHHSNKSIDQDGHTNERKQTVDNETKIGCELIKTWCVRFWIWFNTSQGN